MLHRPARTVVSVVGIGIGILLILFTIGLANGSLRERAGREANVGAEILVWASGAQGLSGSDSPRLPVSLAAEIVSSNSEVAAAVPIIQNTAAASDSTFGSRLVDGINYDQYAAIAGLEITRGRKFVEGHDEVMSDTAWLAQQKRKVGDRLNLYERDFEIVGTYEPAAGGRLKIPLSTMQAQLGAEDKATAILVKVKDGVSVDAVADDLHSRFPDDHIIRTRELEELYMQGLPALNVFLNVVISVAGVTSALIILLTMYTTVTERTRQIGVLKSLGMSKINITWTIVQEALLISFCGVIFGELGTVILKFALTKWSMLNVQIEPRVVLSIVIVGLISGGVGALYPGLRAARLDAVDALNYD